MKRSTLILILAAAALGALVYLFETGREKQPDGEGGESKPAFAFKPEEIAEIKLTRQGQTVSIENREGKWVIVRPVNATANQDAASAVAEAVADARVERFITASPGELKAYGLEQPAVELEIRLRGGGLRRVRLGSADFSGSWVYAQLDESGDVALLPASVLSYSDKSLRDLRDRSLLDVPQHEVKSLGLSNENGRFALTHEDSSWALESPVAGAADSVAAESLLSEVGSTEVEDFVSESAEDLSKYGLDRPKITLAVRPQTGEEISLIIGAKAEDFYYAKRSDRPQVLKVRSSLYDALSVKLAKLYDRNIVRFDADGLVRVRISYGRRTLIAEKGEGGEWVVKEPDFGEGEGPDVTRILNVLKTTRADEVMDRPPARVVSKLARPEAEVRLTDRGGGVQTLWVSAADGEQAYARREGSPLVYKISKYLLRDLSFE